MIFKAKKALGYGITPVLFILFLFGSYFLFSSCQNQYEDYDDRRYRDDRYYDRGYDDRRGGSYRRNDSDLRTVDASSSLRFQPLKDSQFEGEDCEDFEECRDWCDEMFSRSVQDRCENLPEEMVEVLYDTYKSLESAGPSDLEAMDPSALAVLIDMDYRLMESLQDGWGIRGVSALLDYTARNLLVVKAFQYSSNEDLFKQLLLDFAQLNNKEPRLETALSLNIARHRETLPALIERADNEEAMQFVFDLLNDGGCSLDCKKKMLCVREDISRRSFRGDPSETCPYLGRRDRADYCYIQGPDVWSYIENLILDGDLRNSGLANVELNQQMCDSFCSNNNCYL